MAAHCKAVVRLWPNRINRIAGLSL